MFSSGWRYILGALLLATVATSGHAQENQQNPERPANEQKAAPNKFPVPLPVVVIETEESASSRERTQEETRDREHRDLIAQEGMNAAAQQMVGIAAWQTVLIAVGTVALIYTLWLTRQANRAFQVSAERQLRAYVSVSPHGYFADELHSDRIKFGIEIRNSGQTPALIQEIRMGVFMADRIEGLKIDDVEIDPKVVPSDFSLGSNHPHFAYVHFSGFDDDTANKVADKNMHVCAFGVVIYKDVLDRIRTTEFFFQSTGDNFGDGHSIRRMPTHNSAT